MGNCLFKSRCSNCNKSLANMGKYNCSGKVYCSRICQNAVTPRKSNICKSNSRKDTNVGRKEFQDTQVSL